MAHRTSVGWKTRILSSPAFVGPRTECDDGENYDGKPGNVILTELMMTQDAENDNLLFMFFPPWKAYFDAVLVLLCSQPSN